MMVLVIAILCAFALFCFVGASIARRRPVTPALVLGGVGCLVGAAICYLVVLPLETSRDAALEAFFEAARGGAPAPPGFDPVAVAAIAESRSHDVRDQALGFEASCMRIVLHPAGVRIIVALEQDGDDWKVVAVAPHLPCADDLDVQM